jgi:hypothetical protein
MLANVAASAEMARTRQASTGSVFAEYNLLPILILVGKLMADL